MDRVTQFAVVARHDAVEHARLEIGPENAERVGVIVGSGIGGIATLEQQIATLHERGPKRVSPFLIPMMIADMPAGQVSISLGAKGTNFAPVSACATSGHAIGEAAESIRRGAADVIVAGGTEASVTPISIAGFNAMTALSTRNDDQARQPPVRRRARRLRDGRGRGDADPRRAGARAGAQRRSTARCWATAAPPTPTTSCSRRRARRGAVRAMRIALDDAGLRPEDIDYLNAHGTSTPLNEELETQAIKATFGDHAYRLPIGSTKSMTGHLLGAAGGAGGGLQLPTPRPQVRPDYVQALTDNVIPPTINYERPDPKCDLDYKCRTN